MVYNKVQSYYLKQAACVVEVYQRSCNARMLRHVFCDVITDGSDII